MKIMKNILIILLSLVLIGVSSLVIWVKLTVHNLERDVRSYLINQRNYQNNDISKLKGHFSKLPTFTVHVTFKDDSQFTYYYMRDQGNIVQYNCAASDPFENGCKHKE